MATKKATTAATTTAAEAVDENLETTETVADKGKVDKGEKRKTEKDTSPLAGFKNLSVKDEDEPEEVIETKETKEKNKSEVEAEAKGKEKEEGKGKEGDVFEFEVPKDETTTDDEGKPTEETWKNIGEDLGLKFEGDNFTDFKSAYENKIKTLKEEIHTQVLEETKANPELILKDVDEKTRKIIEAVSKGADISEYLDPIGKIDKWVAMEDEALVRENLKAIKNGDKELYTKEQIDEFITEYTEDGTLKKEARKVREELVAQKGNITDNFAEEQNRISLQRDKERDDAILEQTQNFHTATDSIKEFMGGKVSDELRTFVKEGWNSGEIHDLFKDLNKVAEFYLYHTVGKQALEKANGVAHSKGKDEARGKLHNITPALIPGGANRGAATQPAEEGDFGAWGKVREEMAEA